MVYIILSIVTFLFAFKRNGNKYLYLIVIVALILGGKLNEALFPSSFLSPSEWTIVILFMVLLSRDLALNRSYLLNVTWVDKIFFFYVFFAIIIPIFANYNDLDKAGLDLFKFVIPIKTWIVFKIFYCLLFEDYVKGKLNEQVELIFNLVLSISAISALIGILHLDGSTAILGLIDDLWIFAEKKHRMGGTMGGINASGLFYAICAVISIFQYVKSFKKIYVVYFVLFMFALLLTGSFASCGALIFGIFVFFFKYFNAKRLISLVFVLAILFFVGYSIPPLKRVVDNGIQQRIKSQFHQGPRKGIIPSHFVIRYMRWEKLYPYFLEKPIWGYGYKGIPEIENTRTHTHNYYVFLIIYSGIFGLFAYLFLNVVILKRLCRLYQFREEGFLIQVAILMYLITQITQLSFQYGGLSELFGILLALAAIMVRADRKVKSNNLRERTFRRTPAFRTKVLSG